MTDNIKSAIISAVITATGTIIAAYVGNTYIKGNCEKKQWKYFQIILKM